MGDPNADRDPNAAAADPDRHDGVVLAVEEDPQEWLAEEERLLAEERRLVGLNMALSAAFHLMLIAAILVFVKSPAGRDQGLIEVSMEAEGNPRLGDPDAPDQTGVPAQQSSPKAAQDEITPNDQKIDHKALEDAADANAAELAKKLREQQAAEAAAARAAEARRVKGIRSADATVSGNLTRRAGIGNLEPRTFYGLKVHSRRMVFILDVSGSMNIPYAKMNLRNAYATLGPKERFAIVCYDNRIFSWPSSKRLVNATKQNKAAADAWVAELTGGGSTNIYEALKTGFEISGRGETADTFYFLSDGQPTFGITDAGLILKAVRQWNNREAVTIHTVGLGTHDRFLMESLAKENRGKYKPLN